MKEAWIKMGNKYASYHICKDIACNDIELIKSLFTLKPNVDKNIARAIEVFKDPNKQNMMNRFLKLHTNFIICVITNKFISIYDNALSFTTVDTEVKRISKKAKLPILYISNFNDDVLLLGAVKSGKTLAKKHIGQGLDAYGVKRIKSTIHLLHDIEGFCRYSKDAVFEKTENINECERSIEKEFGILLKIDFNDIETVSGDLCLADTHPPLKIYKRQD